MKKSLSKKEMIIKAVENTLRARQLGGSCVTLNQEINLLCGALTVMHLLLDKDKDKLDCCPPTWVFTGMTGRSVTDFEYKKED